MTQVRAWLEVWRFLAAPALAFALTGVLSGERLKWCPSGSIGVAWLFGGPVSSTTKNNGLDGILVGDRSQVEGSDSEFNGANGIHAPGNCLITKNNASNNGEEGIRT